MIRVLVALSLLAVSACAAPIAQFQRAVERGEPALYELPRRSTPACVALSDRLGVVTEQLGLTLAYLDMEPLGMTDGHSAIWLRPDLADDACGRVEVWAHELGHVLQPRTLTGREKQVFADGVSWEVIRRSCGYDPQRRYTAYLASIKADARILTIYRREIEAVATRLLSDREAR